LTFKKKIIVVSGMCLGKVRWRLTFLAHVPTMLERCPN